MSIKSTQHVTRAWAIARVKRINDLACNSEYEQLDDEYYDSDCDSRRLESFVRNYVPLADVEKWTNEMLANKLDEPFFRESIFHNYIVTDTGIDE